MTEDTNYLDMQADFEIIYSQVENEQVMDAFIYQMEQNLDYFTHYYE